MEKGEFEDCLDAIQKRIENLLLGRVPHQEIPDLVHEVLLRLIEDLAKINDEKHLFNRGRKVATGVGANYFRKADNHHNGRLYVTSLNAIEDADEYFLVESQEKRPDIMTEREELIRLLGKTISNLKLNHAEVIEFHYFADMSCEEIAVYLNVSVPAVKMRLKRARDALRNAIIPLI